MWPIHKLLRRLISPQHSHHTKIATSLLLVIFFVTISKFASGTREIAIAWRYGTSELVDGFLLVFNISTLPSTVWLSALTVVAVPEVIRGIQNDLNQSIIFQQELLGLSIVLGIVIGLVLYIAFPILFEVVTTGLEPGVENAASLFIAPLALVAALGMPISFLSVLLLIRGDHKNTLFEAIPPLVIATFVMITCFIGVHSLAFGCIFGYFLHLLTCHKSICTRGYTIKPRFSFTSTHWKTFSYGIGVVLIGQTCMSLTSVIDQYAAGELTTGGISILNYASRLNGMAMGIISLAFTRAVLPYLSNAAINHKNEVKKIGFQWSVLAFIVGTLGVTLFWIVAPELVSFFFKRGAFDEHDSIVVTSVLRSSMLQLPFFSAGIVLVATLSSNRNFIVILISGILALVSKLISNTLLIPLFGLDGIAYGWIVVYLLNLILFLWFIKRSTV